MRGNGRATNAYCLYIKLFLCAPDILFSSFFLSRKNKITLRCCGVAAFLMVYAKNLSRSFWCALTVYTNKEQLKLQKRIDFLRMMRSLLSFRNLVLYFFAHPAPSTHLTIYLRFSCILSDALELVEKYMINVHTCQFILTILYSDDFCTHQQKLVCVQTYA